MVRKEKKKAKYSTYAIKGDINYGGDKVMKQVEELIDCMCSFHCIQLPDGRCT